MQATAYEIQTSKGERMKKSGVEQLAQHPGWKTRKPYVLITVAGGVAYVAKNTDKVDVDILDFDNMEDTAADDLRLSDKEWKYLRKNHPDTFEFFAPSYAKRKQVD